MSLSVRSQSLVDSGYKKDDLEFIAMVTGKFIPSPDKKDKKETPINLSDMITIATTNLMGAAERIGATHVFGLTYCCSNLGVLAYGDAYGPNPRNRES